MLRISTALFTLFAIVWSLAGSAFAQTTDVHSIINEFATAKSFKQVEAVVAKLGETGDPVAAPALRALSDGRLKYRKSDGTVFITVQDAAGLTLFDPVSGQKAFEYLRALFRFQHAQRSGARKKALGLQVL